ncbi:tubulin delta chain-like [Onthophagus taurus]|uniref:tubulin delta chain-like n=1 Tax=Onthophagus taurus TaxID=166361 RepID=UPI0039BE2AD6
MSNVVLQFGQCGNQVGHSFYEFLYNDIQMTTKNGKSSNDYKQEALSKWFNVRKDFLEPKAVLVDTEDKVTKTVNKGKAIKYRNIVSNAYGGSANNWAFGYNSRSVLVQDETLEKLRKEIERCDMLGCIINVLSSSGGTGSGVGSKIIEAVRQEYSSKFIVNVIVFPFKKGDVVTQNYNTLLTLSKLYDVTDCSIIFENDKTHSICSRLFPMKKLQLRDLNNIISQQLASVMQPIKQITLPNLISNVSAHPSYKYLQISSAPYFNKDNSSFEPVQTWPSLLGQVVRNAKTDLVIKNTLCKKIRYIGNVLITRGVSSPQENDIKRYFEPSSYVNWVPDTAKFVHYLQDREFSYYNNYVSLLTNNNNICNSLNFILEDAWNLFVHSAYLHHYAKYGVNDECFLEAFQKLESVLNDYKKL